MTEFAGYEIEVPFGPAAGVLNGINEALLVEQIIDVIKSPVGFVTFGSITYSGDAGNESQYGVVYYHDQATGRTYNAMGLPNIGYRRAVELYPELQKQADSHGKPLIPSIAAGKGENPLFVLPLMAEGFVDAGAQAVEVNYSCPNKITGSGGREPILGHNLEAMQAVDDEIVQRVGNDITIIRKMPRFTGKERSNIPDVAKLFADGRRGKVVLNILNAIDDQRGLTEIGDPALGVPDNIGGMSGPTTDKIGIDQLRRFKLQLPGGVGFIGCLGVMTGRNVFDRVHEHGANLASGVTIYFENEKIGISYGQTGLRIAEQYAEAITTF